MYYLPVNVYRWDLGDYTLNGVTSEKRNERLVVPCEDGYIKEDKLEELGFTVLEYVDKYGGYFKPKGETRWFMMGGNFVFSCDSRFQKVYGDRPIRVHDRIEG